MHLESFKRFQKELIKGKLISENFILKCNQG